MKWVKRTIEDWWKTEDCDERNAQQNILTNVLTPNDAFFKASGQPCIHLGFWSKTIFQMSVLK